MTVRFRTDIPEVQHRAVILGRDASFPRGIAINLLPLSGLDDKAGLLWAVLGNEEDDLDMRHLAAANLWRLNTPEAHAYLLKAGLAVKNPDLLAAVAKFLGRVGGADALEVVAAIERRTEGFPAAQAGFAAALIAHRLGLPGHDLPLPEKYMDLPPGDTVKLDWTAAPGEEIELLVDSLASEPYGIDLAADRALRYACPGGPGLIVLNKALAGGRAVELIHKQKTIFGLLALKNSEDGRYSVSSVILTAPDVRGERVTFGIYRVTGRLAWAGTTTTAPTDQVEFEIRTPETVGIVPLEMAGTLYDSGQTEVHRAVSAGRALQKRRLIPVPRLQTL